MNQTDASDLARTLLDGIIGAMTNRGDAPLAQREARARSLWSLVASCEPQDAIQTMLIGQCLLFNELIADGGKDVLNGMLDTLKLRAQSNVNALSRSLHQNIGMFLRLRDKSSAAEAPQAETRRTEDDARQRLEAVKKKPPVKRTVTDEPVPRPEHAQTGAPSFTPESEASPDSLWVALNDAAPPRPYQAVDPRHGKPPSRSVVEPMSVRSDQARIPELVGSD